jgi:hypothetical protein
MVTITVLLSCLLQAGGPPLPHDAAAALDCMWSVEDSLPTTEPQSRQAQFERQELIRRFNGLITALDDFARTYNSRGVIDVKKTKAIRKAVRELEKSDWFSQKDEHRALR